MSNNLKTKKEIVKALPKQTKTTNKVTASIGRIIDKEGAKW